MRTAKIITPAWHSYYRVGQVGEMGPVEQPSLVQLCAREVALALCFVANRSYSPITVSKFINDLKVQATILTDAVKIERFLIFAVRRSSEDLSKSTGNPLYGQWRVIA